MNTVVHEINFRADQIRSNYSDMKTLNEKIKTQKEVINAEYENNAEYSEAKETIDELKKSMKALKKRIDSTPRVFGMLQFLDELKEEKKDVQDTLFAHLEIYSTETKTNQIMIDDQPMQIVKKFNLKKK